MPECLEPFQAPQKVGVKPAGQTAAPVRTKNHSLGWILQISPSVNTWTLFSQKTGIFL
jgi:hypothetical protein